MVSLCGESGAGIRPQSTFRRRVGMCVWGEASFGEEGDRPDPSGATQRLESQGNLVHRTRSRDSIPQ